LSPVDGTWMQMSDDMVDLCELNDAFVMICSSIEISVYAVETDVSLIMADVCKAVAFYFGEFNFNLFMVSFPTQLVLQNWGFEVCYEGKKKYLQNYLSLPSVAQILQGGCSLSKVP
jgi:hypothetical protein